MPIDPPFLRFLDDTVLFDLESIRDGFSTAAFWSTLTVVVGCAMEVPEVLHELWSNLFPSRFERVIKILSSIGLLFVILGVAGELASEHFGSEYEGLIRSLNEAVLSDTETRMAEAILTVGNVRTSAEVSAKAASAAEDASGRAISSSSEALANASAAQHEADSYARDIAGAKREAANAVSRLADAEQRLADSTQREAAAEAKLSAIKTPRSLIRTKELINVLKSFKGTEFSFNTFLNEESDSLTRQLAPIFRQAGWIRKQPLKVNIGVPTFTTVFEIGEKGELVPSCLDSGVAIHITDRESLAQLQATPSAMLSQTLRAAVALHDILGASISPADEHNVALVSLDSAPEDEKLRICVGSKP